MDNNQVTGQFAGKVIIGGVPVDADSIERIQACLAACQGITTEQLGIATVAQLVAAAVLQRDAAIAALRSIKQEVFYGIKEGAAERIDAIVTPILATVSDNLLPLTATGGANEGRTNHLSFITKLLESATGDRFTSVSKGGAYERLGAIRGAGSFKGLAGIAYLDEKGSLFIREPECFTKRMIKVEGGAQ